MSFHSTLILIPYTCITLACLNKIALLPLEDSAFCRCNSASSSCLNFSSRWSRAANNSFSSDSDVLLFELKMFLVKILDRHQISFVLRMVVCFWKAKRMKNDDRITNWCGTSIKFIQYVSNPKFGCPEGHTV